MVSHRNGRGSGAIWYHLPSAHCCPCKHGGLNELSQDEDGWKLGFTHWRALFRHKGCPHRVICIICVSCLCDVQYSPHVQYASFMYILP